MKRVIPIFLVLVIVGAFAGTLVFLYRKSQRKPVVYETQTPTVTDIVKKTVATGALVPRQEVAIKPRVSGVLEKLHVQPGQHVEKDELLAEIRIIPNVVSLNQAESAVKAARIAFQNAQRELARNRSLFEQAVISEAELGRYQLDYELKQQDLEAAESNLQLIKEGAARNSSKVSNHVRSTVAGMVLEVPVKEGESVIESNNFNAGTTVASIADMNDLIFQGRVDESEVGKLKEGMALDIKIGALEEQKFQGTLEYISPKGIASEGVIEFEIRAAIQGKPDVLIRAGYSANADVVLDRRQQVLAIDEGLLQFDDGKPFVEVEVGPQAFERRPIEVGLSDGIHIEVLGGIDAGTKIKKPQSGVGAARGA